MDHHSPLIHNHDKNNMMQDDLGNNRVGCIVLVATVITLILTTVLIINLANAILEVGKII